MSEQIKIAFTSFGRGVATFVRPWRTARRQPPKRDPPRGIGRHFAAVGLHLWRAVDQFESEHPEIAAHA